MFSFCFSAIHPREAIFYSLISKSLQKSHGIKSLIISFCRENDLYLERQAVPFVSVFNEYQKHKSDTVTETDLVEAEIKFGIDSFRKLCRHEIVANMNSSDWEIIKRGIFYLRIVDKIFQQNSIDTVVQEIGGWLACESIRLVAQKFGVKHVYVEPSLFPKKCFFWVNHCGPRLNSRHLHEELSQQDRDKWLAYIAEFKNAKSRIIPTKDKKMVHDVGLQFFLNSTLPKKALRSLWRKYYVNQNFETVAPLHKIAGYYLSRMYNRFLNGFHYSQLRRDSNQKLVYYPLHHPVDFQLLVRAPQYFKQDFLIENIASQLPANHILYVKEHPVCVGAYPHSMIRRISRLPNVRILHPMVLTHEIAAAMDVIVTVNSKVGYESLFYGKPVITLAESVYSHIGLTRDLDRLSELSTAIKSASEHRPNPANLAAFLHSADHDSNFFDLYNFTDENVFACCLSLMNLHDKSHEKKMAC